MAYYSGGGGGGGGKMSAVDAILAEAADLVELEQIAKLNTAHLPDDHSALPSSLEARFRKLKSLPSATAPATPPPARTLARSVTAPHPAAALPAPNPPASYPAPPEHGPAPAAHEDPPPPADAETESGGSSPRQARAPAPAPAVHADADDDAEDLERLFGSGPRGRPTLRERNRGRDSASSSASPPPPRQACCFGFSPKKPLQRAMSAKGKKKVHHGSGDSDVLGVDADEWGDDNRRMATELREQQRRLRKALEDQVQVSRETAKMARWVKQASARMTHAEAIDDLLSDCEDDEEELK